MSRTLVLLSGRVRVSVLPLSFASRSRYLGHSISFRRSRSRPSSAHSAKCKQHPRTWEAQFLSGIKTIALIAIREGVVQLGAVHKVIEDLSYVVLLRKKFSYIKSILGVLLPLPSSSAYPYKVEGYGAPEQWHFQGSIAPQAELYDPFNMPLQIIICLFLVHCRVVYCRLTSMFRGKS